MKVKTIDVYALEWFDKVNGNSYFAGTVTVNFGMKTEKQFNMPYQYGYGSSNEQEALNVLQKAGLIDQTARSLWQVKEKGIILRTSKYKNCKLRELKAIGKGA